MDREYHSQYVDPVAERELSKYWNERPNLPPLLRALLPPDTHFIKRQLNRPGTPSSIKMSEPGEALMVRAYYNYNERKPNGLKVRYHLGTNVTFSKRALIDNMENPLEDNWLVGRNAKAAVLYLHGGGTSTTGAHSAVNLISHLSRRNIDVVGLDLGWHGQGHREFFSFESEIKALSEFAKKYIPPNVPLFVWGHSWGGVFADKIMTMTDRPNSEFFFHSNLAGTIIMSPAVDSAPGKTVVEKFKAFIERLHIAKETSKDFGNEIEKLIYVNIILDGKVSAVGNMVSSGSILQSEQSIPSHQGRLYVPSMMLVGIHDTLVYTAWKDLIHQRYDHLENIPAPHRHYIDKGYVEVGRDKFAEVPMGHLVAGFRARPNRGSGMIQHDTTLNFMEQQLRLHPIRRAILNAVRESQNGIPLEGEVKKRISYLPSYEAAREYVATEVQNVPRETIDDIIHQINTAESSRKFLLPKINNKATQVPYVDVVQNAANNLGFRGFLLSYHHVDQRSNQRHMAVRESPSVSNDINLLLHPFNSPLKRAFHVVRELSREESDFDYNTLREELDLVINLEEGSKFSISSELLKDLRLLRRIIGSLPNDRDALRKEARDIIERNQNAFTNVNIDIIVPRKKINNEELLGFTLSYENDLDAVRARLEKERIPEPVRREVLRLKRELMLNRAIADGRYVPGIPELTPLLLFAERSDRTVGRVREVLEKIEEEAVERLELLAEQEVLRDSLKENKTKRDALRKKVVQAIRIIKRGLEAAREAPPNTDLKDVEEKSAEELKRLVEAQDKMEDELTQYSAEVFLREELRSTNEIIDGYNSGYRKYVDHFTDLFREYIENRKAIDTKILIAIQKGGMGEEFKKAVTDLYGVGFDGTKVRESIYLELIEATYEVAKLEKQLKDNAVEVMQATKDYDNEIKRLLDLITTRRSTGADPNVVVEGEMNRGIEAVPNVPLNHPVLNRLRSAVDLYNYRNINMDTILRGESGQEREISLVENMLIVDRGNVRRLNGGVPGRRRDTRLPKEELIKYIKHHRAAFDAVLAEYKDAVDRKESQDTLLPPELPLIPLEEVLVNETRLNGNGR